MLHVLVYIHMYALSPTIWYAYTNADNTLTPDTELENKRHANIQTNQIDKIGNETKNTGNI